MRRHVLGIASTFAVIVLIATIATAAAMGVGLPRLFRHSSGAVALTCPSASPASVRGIAVPAGPIGGYCQDRLQNAAAIIAAAQAQGIGPHTQAVAVMTAIGESDLVNLSHGDAAGPDSRGLFQQRANGAWGTLADRMNPYTAATMFFDALIAQPGWKTMTPTEAAHTVQGNADPGYYAQFWPTAKQIVHVLTGVSVPDRVAPQSSDSNVQQ